MAVSQDKLRFAGFALDPILVVGETTINFCKEALIAAGAFVQHIPQKAGGTLASARVPFLASLRKRTNRVTLPTYQLVVLYTRHANSPLSSTGKYTIAKTFHYTSIILQSVPIFASDAGISVIVIIEAFIYKGMLTASSARIHVIPFAANQALIGKGVFMTAIIICVTVGNTALLGTAKVLGRIAA